jgi:hypothetical protein
MKRFTRAAIPAILALAPFAASAQLKLLPPCTADGNCSISDILVVFGNLAEFLLGIVGAVALLYFVYGGFVFILSRGNKGEVDKAFGILRSAAIGIFIIFLSGVFVRFTIQALTGGSSAVPTVGENCDVGTQKSNTKGAGLWVLMPAGVRPDGSVIPQGLLCLAKEDAAKKAGDDCLQLNKALSDRGRTEKYSCIDVNTATTSCVRGLCSQLSSQFACCKKP